MLNTGTLVGKNWGVRKFFDFHMLLVHSVGWAGLGGCVVCGVISSCPRLHDPKIKPFYCSHFLLPRIDKWHSPELWLAESRSRDHNPPLWLVAAIAAEIYLGAEQFQITDATFTSRWRGNVLLVCEVWGLHAHEMSTPINNSFTFLTQAFLLSWKHTESEQGSETSLNGEDFSLQLTLLLTP